jgi:hypothetical protein
VIAKLRIVTRTIARRLCAAIPLTAAAVIVSGVTAFAQPKPGGSLELIIHHGQGTTGPDNSVTVDCDPVGGTHPRAAQVCEALRTVDGDLSRLPSGNMICTEEYSPVTAHALGTWHGRQVSYQKTFGNGCHLRAATNPVFLFD